MITGIMVRAGNSYISMSVPKNAWAFIVAFLFSAVLCWVPWNTLFLSIYGYEFIDRSVYLNYFMYEPNIIEYKEFDTYLSYILNEYLWHYLIPLLTQVVGLQVESVFLAISFFMLFVFAFIVGTRAHPWATLLLINPLVVELAFSQLRLALAISLLGVAYLLKKRSKIISVPFLLLSIFIHTASILFVAIFFSPFLVTWVKEKYGRGKFFEFITLVLTGAAISILIGPMRELVLSYIGDRRAEYPDMSSSFLYSLFWIFLLIPFSISYRKIVDHDYASYAIVVISIVATNVFHGGYSTRFLAASFPFLISSFFVLSQQIRYLVVLTFLLYALFQWLYWLRLLGGA